MAQHNDLGNKGEEIAVGYLISKNYLILEKNHRIGKAEIDIIARKDSFLVIVEVKSRTNQPEIRTEEILTSQKTNLLIEAAERYMEAKNLDLELRLDLILVHFFGENHRIEHVEEILF